jgi:hypothetical protein
MWTLSRQELIFAKFRQPCGFTFFRMYLCRATTLASEQSPGVTAEGGANVYGAFGLVCSILPGLLLRGFQSNMPPRARFINVRVAEIRTARGAAQTFLSRGFLRSLVQLRPQQPWNRALNSMSAARLHVQSDASHGEDGVRLQGLDVLRHGGGPRPRCSVSGLEFLARFLFSSLTPKKGDLYPRTVLSSRHGQFGFRRGLRDLQNDA